MTTSRTTPPADHAVSAVYDILAHASRVVVLCTVPLADADSQVTCPYADRGVWRDLAQTGRWRASTDTRDNAVPRRARTHGAGVARYRPGPAHLATASLQAGLTHCDIITPSTDWLFEMAGTENVWHLNGHVPAERCTHCARVDVARPRPGSGSALRLPSESGGCAHCGAATRAWPDRALASTPQQAWLQALQRVQACDAMLWLADDDLVYPAAEFAHTAVVVAGAKLILASQAPHALDRLADVPVRADPTQLLGALAARVQA